MQQTEQPDYVDASAWLMSFAAHEILDLFKESTLARRIRIRRDCATWEFDAYRVLSAAGLADKNPVRDAEYQDYLRWKAEPPKTITFRRFTALSSSPSRAPGS